MGIRGKQTIADKSVQVLDVLKLSAGSPAAAVKSFTLSDSPTIVACDILIVGGGTGGTAAALQAALSGLQVAITEETDWLGGQMTAQGVSALDENYLVETTGSTLKYQQLRSKIRHHYRTEFQLRAEADEMPTFNPGKCWVSELAFEPKVALSVIGDLLDPCIATGAITVYHRTKAIGVRQARKRVKSVRTVNLDTGENLEFRPKICLDATELGDLLPLAKIDYRTGSEPRTDTGEPHAPPVGDPENVQDFVFPLAVEFRPGENHTIDKPLHYDDFKERKLFSFFGYKMFDRATIVDTDGGTRQVYPFWTYRRLLARSNWLNPPYDYDLSMINWMANDLRSQNMIDKPPDETAGRLALGKALSLGFLYWLQTEAPRDDGGQGYPELLLRPEVMGTADGLSKYPYIRESRRIKAHQTVVEQDIAAATNSSARARLFSDSAGIGFYPIDIHGREDIPGAAQPTKPFQLPLAALIPDKHRNLLASAKNIGTTHITNGSYRLHPVEWAIGEAAGALAAFAIRNQVAPPAVLKQKRLLRTFQRELVGQGTPVYWYDDVPVCHPQFPAIQFLAVTGIMTGALEDLRFRPDDALTREEAALALARLLKPRAKPNPRRVPADVDQASASASAVVACLKDNLLSLDCDGKFSPSRQADWQDLESAAARLEIPLPESNRTAPVTRAGFANWLSLAAASARLLGKL